MGEKLGGFALFKQWLLPIDAQAYNKIRFKKLADFKASRIYYSKTANRATEAKVVAMVE
jgi:hypothetical protein